MMLSNVVHFKLECWRLFENPDLRRLDDTQQLFSAPYLLLFVVFGVFIPADSSAPESFFRFNELQ